MAGTKAGSVKAVQTIYKRHGKDHFSRIGALGGKKGTTGGFYYSMVNGLDTHIVAGRKGGMISKRRKMEA